MIDVVRIGAEKAGGLGKLALAFGIKHQAFYSWKRVPAERVLQFERVTGIARSVIRPDLYPPQHADADARRGSPTSDVEGG